MAMTTSFAISYNRPTAKLKLRLYELGPWDDYYFIVTLRSKDTIRFIGVGVVGKSRLCMIR